MPVTDDTVDLLRRLRLEVGTLADNAVRQTAEVWLATWDTLSPYWQAAVTAAIDQAAATGRWPSSWQLARIPQVATATAVTERESDSLGKTVLEVAVVAAVGAVAVTAAAEPFILASQLPRSLAVHAAAGFAGKLLPGRLDTIRVQTRRRVTGLIQPLAGLALASAKQALIRGSTSDGTPTVAASLLDRLRAAFTAGINRATTVIATETLDAYRATSAYAHDAFADTAGLWRWTCACDLRSCPACWALDGSLHALTVGGPDGHQGCRCARLILAKPWAQLGFSATEPADVLPDAETRFRKLSHADQLQIMGPARLALLDSGDITWADLVTIRSTPGWRDAAVPQTVAGLQRIAGRRTKQ